MTPDLICPRCHLPLKEVRTSYGVFWKCGNCDGRAITVELLRRTFTEESINPLWLHAMRGEGESSGPCPMCKHLVAWLIWRNKNDESPTSNEL